MFAIKCLSVLLLCVGSVMSQLELKGQCPETQPMPNFDFTQYLGQWFDIVAYPSFTEIVRRCDQSFTVQTGENTLNVTGGALQIPGGERIDLPWTAEIQSPGVYTLSQPFNPTYDVLDSDYVNYASIYACEAINATHYRARALVYGRQNEIAEEYLVKGLEAFKKYDVPLQYFIALNQTGCTALFD